MSESDALVRRLAADLQPVQPLASPVRRGLSWAVASILVLIAVGTVTGLRGDLETRLADVGFVLSMLAALATGVTAAIAALVVSLPDRSRAIALLPVAPALLWASSVGYGCLTNWISISEGSVTLNATVTCLAIVAATSVPLALVSAFMLRHAARLQPRLVSILAAIAVTGVASFALNLFHQLEASALVLIWNIAMAAVMSILATLYGRRFLSWDRLGSAFAK
jgi:hypothetical protein